MKVHAEHRRAFLYQLTHGWVESRATCLERLLTGIETPGFPIPGASGLAWSFGQISATLVGKPKIRALCPHTPVWSRPQFTNVEAFAEGQTKRA